MKAVEFGSGVVGVNRQLMVTTTALGFVGGGLALQGVRVGISPLEAGVAQRAEFNLRKAGPRSGGPGAVRRVQ